MVAAWAPLPGLKDTTFICLFTLLQLQEFFCLFLFFCGKVWETLIKNHDWSIHEKLVWLHKAAHTTCSHLTKFGSFFSCMFLRNKKSGVGSSLSHLYHVLLSSCAPSPCHTGGSLPLASCLGSGEERVKGKGHAHAGSEYFLVSLAQAFSLISH